MARVELEFFPFFVDAFLSATSTWPAQRVGAYVRLLSYQWKHGSVPGDDMDELHRIILEPIEVSVALWERLAVKFPKGADGYQNAKLEKVRADVLRRTKGQRKRTRAATQAAAAARRSANGSPHDDDDGSVTDSVTDSPTDDKSGNLETLKEIPPQPARRAGLVSLSQTSREAIEGILASLTVAECATADRFHAVIVARFQALGWSVTREVRVPNRGDGRAGYVDVVVSAPDRIALELDRNMPRDKSIEKVLTLADDGYAPVVICRSAPAAGWWTERRGVEVWGLGEEPTPMYSTRSH